MRVGGIVGAEVVGFTVVGVAVVGALVGAVGAAEVGVEEGTGVGLAVGVKTLTYPIKQGREDERTPAPRLSIPIFVPEDVMYS